VAATKCRNKKKLKTQILVRENETLVSTNESLKSEIAKLEREKRRLSDVLAGHESSCPKRIKTSTMTSTMTTQQQQQQNFDDILGDVAGYSKEDCREPPSFSDPLGGYPPLPSIKVEDLSSPIDDDIFLRPPEPLPYYDGFQSHGRLHGYHHHHHHVPSSSHHFLGVKTLAHTYLDLDSRCIAL
jgi:hypothetical protein